MIFLPALSFLFASLHDCDSSAVEKAFLENEIVPDSIAIAPTKIVNVLYPSGVSAHLGNVLMPTQVKDKPVLTWEGESDAFYSLVLFDPDAPSRQNREWGESRHWLVMNIPGSSLDQGDEVLEYIGSCPDDNTGLHRYIYLIYKQPNGFIQHNEGRATNRSGDHRGLTHVAEFAQKYNLGAPEFGNFYQAPYDTYSDILQKQLEG